MTVDDWPAPVSVAEMYGEWDYEAAVEALSRSLDPRPSASLLDSIGSIGLSEGDTVVDIGGREGRDCLILAERFWCRGVSVDPVPANIARGGELVAEHEYGHLVELRLGTEAEPTQDPPAVVAECRFVAQSRFETTATVNVVAGVGSSPSTGT